MNLSECPVCRVGSVWNTGVCPVCPATRMPQERVSEFEAGMGRQRMLEALWRSSSTKGASDHYRALVRAWLSYVTR